MNAPQLQPDRTEEILSHLKERVLVLDGAMGTMIQRHSLTEADFRGERFANHAHDLKGNNDLLLLTRPEIIQGIHEQYLAAGADIIETNTFNATRLSQSDYKLEDIVYELNVAGAALARAACDKYTAQNPAKPRLVAGVIGPTSRTASISPDVNDPGARNVTFDELVSNYKEAANGLIDGGADTLLIETVFDTLNAKAAVVAVEQVFADRGRRWPVMISGTITDASGRTLSGQTAEAFWTSLAHARPISMGLNCALGAKELRPHVETLSRICPTYISAHPNAGLPNAFGGYDETPEMLAEDIREWAVHGLVNIVGGCCGTTPDHIRAIANAVADVKPRQPAEVPHRLRLSGLEPCEIGPESFFVNVGERTNVTGSAKFKKLILSGDYEAAVEVARDQVDFSAGPRVRERHRFKLSHTVHELECTPRHHPHAQAVVDHAAHGVQAGDVDAQLDGASCGGGGVARGQVDGTVGVQADMVIVQAGFECDGFFLRERMAAGNDQDEFIFSIRQHLQLMPLAGHARVADAQVGRAFLHGANHLGAQVFLEVDLDRGVLADESAKVFRQELHDRRNARVHADVAAHAVGVFAELALHLL